MKAPIKAIMLRLCIPLFCLGIGMSAHAKLPISVVAQHHNSISSMLKHTMPAVVNIISIGDIPLPNDPFLQQKLDRLKKMGIFKNKQFTSIGSGVIINAQNGLIVTNAHVVNLGKSIVVTLNDGRHYNATKIGQDDDSDIALLKIDAKHLTAIPFADSNKLKVGDFVAAIGSPFGLNQSVTSGIISALHRTDLGIEGIENFIQTDAPINVGNSGGALVNTTGQLVGINTAIASPGKTGGSVGIGFAIPANMVKSVVAQLLEYGAVHRGMMGVLVQTLTPSIAKAFGEKSTHGAIVTQLVPHSPAQRAGLKVGDIISKINGKTITSNGDVQNLVGLLRVGSDVSLDVIRNNQHKTITVQTGDPKRTDDSNRKDNPYLYGVTLQNTVLFSTRLGRTSGVKIVKMMPYSPAIIAGLRSKDTIISVNHIPTPNIQALRQAAKKTKPNVGLLVHFIRHKGAAFIVVK